MSMFHSSQLPDTLLDVCKTIAGGGGKAWLVGGCIRDLLTNNNPKDFDIEVYGLDVEALKKTIAPLGRTESLGRHFGIIKLWSKGLEIDIALPRIEKKITAGHRGFDVESIPDLSPEKASLRRDFTINSIMFDPLTDKLLDIHGGQDDLKNKRLRHVGPAFSEDPLRPLRAMQFAARFQLSLAAETATLCRKMLAEAGTLPASRIWREWQKWAHAPHPSYGLQALRETGWLALYPELLALIDCPQDPRWHPEGDVWIHSLHVCDKAALIARRHGLETGMREHLLFSALCHDLGKPACTCTDMQKSIRSPGHSKTGAELSRRFLHRIHAPKYLFQHLQPLIREHMAHMHGKPTARAIRRLAHRLQPSNIEMWEMLVEADASGRPPAPCSRPAKPWLEEANRLRHHRISPKPIITGKMLLNMGLMPGPDMGRIINSAYEAQLDGEFCDEISASIWCNENISPDAESG